MGKSKSYKWIPGHPLQGENGLVDIDLLDNYIAPVEETTLFDDIPVTSSRVRDKSGGVTITYYNAKGNIINYEKLGIDSFHYIKDEMEPTKHPINGKQYTSKKKFRDETRAHGCIEVGNSHGPLNRKRIELSRSERVAHIKRTIEQLKSR